MTLGEKLRDLRKANYMSQEKMAEMLGVSRQAVSKWENGTSLPTTENLISLSKIFNVTVEQLVHPDTHVELVLDIKKEVLAMKEKSNGRPVAFWVFLGLGLLSLLTAFLGSMNWGFTAPTIFIMMGLAAIFVYCAIVPIMVRMLKHVRNDCKNRGIKPTFWMIASTTWIGLLYYLMKRDELPTK